jgi:calcineurin-like phosphoesterase family protein
MSTWFTSDMHFGHENIIRYSHRPFRDVSHMHEGLIERWNDVVQPDDTVWVLGDVAMGTIEESLRCVSRLNGRKLLVAGNHDRCWSFHGAKHERWITHYQDAGFAEIHQGQISFDLDGRLVDLCHFPYRGDSQYEDRYLDARPVDSGAWLLHGHVHETWKQWGRMINVGCDVWDYRPVAASELAELISQGPTDREFREQTVREAT